jgi:hypothetical protein
MLLPRVRFTVRRLMMLVMLLALGFSGTHWVMEMKRLTARYCQLSAGYEIDELFYSDPAFGPPNPVERDRLVRHIARLRVKYDYAARHPWQWVDPDPPEPIEATKWRIKISRDLAEDEVPTLDAYPNHPPRF